MSRIAIRNCDVIDGMGIAAQRGMDVARRGQPHRLDVGRGERNGSAGRRRHRVIDGTGKTVMPGLIDAHCHMTYGESMTQEEQDIFTSVEGRTLRAAWNVQKVLAAGVTGISQPGGSYFIGVAVRDGIKAKKVKGPRMTSAGRYITTSNGLTDWYPDDAGVVEGGIGIRCNTLDEMIAEVRRQVKNGVDFIKLADSPFGEYQSFRDEELKAIADLAHQLNRRCTIHARGDAEMNAAVAGRLRLGHARQHHDPGHRRAPGRAPDAARPDAAAARDLGRVRAAHRAPPYIVDACKRMLERTHTSLHMAHEAGVKFVLGTDTGFAMTPYGEWHAKELELLMKYGGRLGARGDRARRPTTPARRSTSRARSAASRRACSPTCSSSTATRARTSPSCRTRRGSRRSSSTARSSRSTANLESWPNEQSLTYAQRNLTQELVADGRSLALTARRRR